MHSYVRFTTSKTFLFPRLRYGRDYDTDLFVYLLRSGLRWQGKIQTAAKDAGVAPIYMTHAELAAQFAKLLFLFAVIRSHYDLQGATRRGALSDSDVHRIANNAATAVINNFTESYRERAAEMGRMGRTIRVATPDQITPPDPVTGAWPMSKTEDAARLRVSTSTLASLRRELVQQRAASAAPARSTRRLTIEEMRDSIRGR